MAISRSCSISRVRRTSVCSSSSTATSRNDEVSLIEILALSWPANAGHPGGSDGCLVKEEIHHRGTEVTENARCAPSARDFPFFRALCLSVVNLFHHAPHRYRCHLGGLHPTSPMLRLAS